MPPIRRGGSVANPGATSRRQGLAQLAVLGLMYAAIGSVAWAADVVPALAPAGGTEDGSTEILEALVVTADRLHVSDVEGPVALERFGATDIEDSGVFSLDEFFETLPPGESGDEQLVYINGEPAYLDPSQLPLGMIESVEVSLSGSMPQYGARANGRVINIRLKENYNGRELGARLRAPFDGGGEEMATKLSASVARGKLRALVSLNTNDTDLLLASERSFSRDQDRTSQGGRDLRLSWGTPAVVQAAEGPLAGLVDPTGAAVDVALAPENQNGQQLTTADFLTGATDRGAADQRRFNTAPYRTLVSPSQRTNATFGLNYTFSPRLNVGLTGSYSESDGTRFTAPPVSTPSEDTLVPAAFNPFGQDVMVGLVHLEFGPVLEQSESRNTQVGLTVGGRLGDSWRWQSGVGYQRSESERSALDLDSDRLAAALAATDPVARFNPFGDPRSGPVNAHLYPDLTIERLRLETSTDTRLDLSANGEVAHLPGGPVQVALRANHRDRNRERLTRNALDGDEPIDLEGRSSYSLSGSTTVPLIGDANARPGLRRLTTELSAEYEAEGHGGYEREGELGLAWAPIKQWVLRAGLSADAEAPPRDVDELPESIVGETYVDPRRGSMIATDVQPFVGETINVQPASSLRRSFGFTFEPEAVPGLRLSAGYDSRTRRRMFEDDFDPQDVINNEGALSGRVVRAEPTAEDLALGRPGRIVAVDLTPGSVGRAASSDVDFRIDYRRTSERLGRIRLNLSATRMLDAYRELAPGVPFLEEGSGRYNPPDWRVRSMISWSRGSWNTSVRLAFTSAAPASATGGEIPAHGNADWNLGYRFRQPFLGAWGKGLQVAVGINNVFDRAPPFADTIDGYRGGSPLGRTGTMSFTLPL